MVKAQINKIATAALVAFGLLLLTDKANSHNVISPSDFTVKAQRILQTISTGNIKGFVVNASRDGVLVVKRNVDWASSQNLIKDHLFVSQEKYTSQLNLNGMHALVWRDEEIRFNYSELDTSNFRQIFKQFQGLVKNTQDGYSHSIVTTTTGKDAWGSRYLGPVIQGKIASNTWWYIYLVREQDAWKVWKLEYVIH